MSKLILVPTPIGNLKDITLRAVDVLNSADLIFAEDTRKTGYLLKHLQISKPLQSFHKFNEHKLLEKAIEQMKEGMSVALVSDAGTPGISDPGFLLVRECLKNGILVETLPGATALIPALINSGLPCDRFVFEGFLPQKKGRSKRISFLSGESRTMIFYESPQRIHKTLAQLASCLGPERQASLSRELSKIHEETLRGTLAEIISSLDNKQIKGEITIVVAGK